MLLETIFLTTLGAGFGLFVALITIEAIKKLSWQSLCRLQYRLQEVSVDINALIFIVFVSLLVALLAGILPALSLSRNDAGAALKDESNRTGTSGKQRHRVQGMLVIGQVASACVLLISAGLLARSFQAAQNLPIGFDPQNTLTVELVLKAKKYLTDDAQTNLFWKTVLEKARALPGVNAAGDVDHRNIYTVVGVVPHLRYNRPDYLQRAFQAYFPYTQNNGRDQVLLMRTAGNSASLITSARKLVASIDSTLPVTRIEPLDDAIAKIYAPQRIASYVICLFSGAALFLSAVGLYGVLAYAVAQRTREIGIRIAVGARSTNILRLVIRQGLKLAGTGLLIGVVAALILSRLMSSMLYGVSATDPVSLLVAILVLGLAALLACLLPALRATKIDPITALRE